MNKFAMITALALISFSISSSAKTIYADIQVTDMVPTSHFIWQRKNQNTPKYPIKLARSGVRGCAILAFNISTTGKTENLEIINSIPKKSIGKSAGKILKKWHWIPVSSQQKLTSEKRMIRFDICLGGESTKHSQQYCIQQTKFACS